MSSRKLGGILSPHTSVEYSDDGSSAEPWPGPSTTRRQAQPQEGVRVRSKQLKPAVGADRGDSRQRSQRRHYILSQTGREASKSGVVRVQKPTRSIILLRQEDCSLQEWQVPLQPGPESSSSRSSINHIRWVKLANASKNRQKAADSMDGAQVVLLTAVQCGGEARERQTALLVTKWRTWGAGRCWDVTRSLPVGLIAVFFAVAASEKDGGGNAYRVWVRTLTSKSVLSRLSSALRRLVLRWALNEGKE